MQFQVSFLCHSGISEKYPEYIQIEKENNLSWIPGQARDDKIVLDSCRSLPRSTKRGRNDKQGRNDIKS
jgi:hypothetical protein